MQTKEVYIVTSGSYFDYHIEFTTLDREKAETYVHLFGGDCNIEEHDLDNPVPRPLPWTVQIDAVTGNVVSADVSEDHHNAVQHHSIQEKAFTYLYFFSIKEGVLFSGEELK